MEFRVAGSRRGRQAVAYLSLLLVFYALMLLLIRLDEMVNLSLGAFDTRLGGTILVIACVFLAVLAAHGVGEVGYVGVTLVVLVGVSGILYFMAASLVGFGFSGQVIEESWRDFLTPVGAAWFSLFIIRRFTIRSSGRTSNGASHIER